MAGLFYIGNTKKVDKIKNPRFRVVASYGRLSLADDGFHVTIDQIVDVSNDELFCHVPYHILSLLVTLILYIVAPNCATENFTICTVSLTIFCASCTGSK